MAHFAELDSNNKVLRVIVVGNDIAANGGTLEDNDMHVDGETWCINFFKGGNWKQTSYNKNFRKTYAGIGMVYDPVKDKFLHPQPHASWALDANDDWQAPVTYPTDTTAKSISWDESNQKWTAKDFSDPQNNFNWDASTLAWVSA
jgi:hypothetical protein|tara:strand:+ start:501 stop:935 length:435 start_codon:yes stop_codon:yes gene_type:complete